MDLHNLIQSLGFAPCATGGGCHAYLRSSEQGQMLITADDAPFPTDGDARTVQLGLYDADGIELRSLVQITPRQLIPLLQSLLDQRRAA